MAERDRTDDGTRAFYDRISRVYDAVADAAEHAARERGQALLDPRPGERVLEVGPGPGRALAAFARAVGEAGLAVGLDLSPGMAAEAARRAAAASVAGVVRLVVGDARAAPFRDASFDAAFLSFALELFDGADLADVVAEVRRALVPGGRVAVVHMAATEEGGAMERLYAWAHRRFPRVVDCRPIDAAGALRHGGFRVARSEAASVAGLPVGIVLAERPKGS